MQIIANDKQAGGPKGLAAWLLTRFGGRIPIKFHGLGQARNERRMKLAETLSLGGKRQLMLVICDGQRYLVGASGEDVGTIVAVADSAVRSEAGPVVTKMRERVL